jgi:hypothetical protein
LLHPGSEYCDYGEGYSFGLIHLGLLGFAGHKFNECPGDRANYFMNFLLKTSKDAAFFRTTLFKYLAGI